MSIKQTFAIIHTFRSIVNHDFEFIIDNCSIEIKSSENFLGVVIDVKLKFDSHIKNTCKKLSKSIGILYKLQNFVPFSVMKQLYYSLIYPYLNYCIRAWGGTYISHVNQLNILQKRAIRIINKKPYLSHTNYLFFSNKILRVPDISKLKVGIYMYSSEMYNAHQQNHVHNTRSRNNLVSSFQRLNITQNSMTYIGPKIWNEIPNYVKTASSLRTFKYLYKSFLISKYSGE